MEIGTYDLARDREAVRRMWQEIGWIDGTVAKETEALDFFIEASTALVARVDGAAECLAVGTSGSMQYLDAAVPMVAVLAVTTSPVVRKRGLAGRLTARLIADHAMRGAALAVLGIFDQGYYERLGFGTGSYEHRLKVSPADLKVPLPDEPVCRLTPDDWEEMHACRVRRVRRHGFMSLDPPLITRAKSLWSKKGFGLGFRDPSSRQLTHFLWCEADDLEDGPYRIVCMVYSSYREFLELLGILKSLEDQVRQVTIKEPPGMQLQDVINRPFRSYGMTRGSNFAAGMEAYAPWQARICDLPGCLDSTHLACSPVRFNLALSDPIESLLEDDGPWRGVAGRYVVTLGKRSAVETGSDGELPTLTASVNALTRMWLGVQPATGLAATDDLAGPESLLGALDEALRLPVPRWDWGF